MFRSVKVGFIVLGIALLVACVPNKKLVYVQDGGVESVHEVNNTYFVDEPVDNTIRQGDELYIRISSADETETVFDRSVDTRVYDPALISHTVDDNGYVKLPYVDRVKVSGLLLNEAADRKSVV